ncbi:MAG: hypothetical protein ACREMB_17175 [Candidatus Rokuibacteriota bacterium]
MPAGKVRTMVVTVLLALGSAGAAEGWEGPWTAHIRTVDEALDRSDADAAARAWQEAYVAALGSLRWEGMLAVGDASLRIAQVSGRRQTAAATARNAFLAALFRARQQDSLDGILRTAEAFVHLGDREMAEQCLRLARDLAAKSADAGAEPRVRALATRLAEWPATAGRTTR